MTVDDAIEACLLKLADERYDPLDLVPAEALVEKLIELELQGPPAAPANITAGLAELAGALDQVDTKDVKLVVFGGGTGLSNVIGGDSRNPAWPKAPFHGLKELFPRIRSIVCVTDDGGSTGELLKDLPLIALGDLRHVLLASIRKRTLRKQYRLDSEGAARVAGVLHGLFNYRYSRRPASAAALISQGDIALEALPAPMQREFTDLLERLFSDQRLSALLDRPHCLGNLLLAAGIYRQCGNSGREDGLHVSPADMIKGLRFLSDLMGAGPDTVLPCTTTPAHLKMLYANGVLVTGEYKSAYAQRGYPMDRVFVAFASKPHVPPEVLDAIREADVILFAPGSLFTSIIPILQVPGIAEAVRRNQQALKILVANLWIQKGETDLVRDDPARRFYVSDLLTAYHRNIPGGVHDLFHEVMALSLQDIPGSILQRYAVEEKVPIYLDRGKVKEMGFAPVESRIFSQSVLDERQMIQHGPSPLARAVRTIWAVRDHLGRRKSKKLPPCYRMQNPVISPGQETPGQRLRAITDRLQALGINEELMQPLADIFWRHWDIPVSHLDQVKGVLLVESRAWSRSQEWDRIYSFYDPYDGLIKIRHDVFGTGNRFEIAFLVALGQSLLGNYALAKEMAPIGWEGETLGKMYRLTLRPAAERECYFNAEELERFLRLTRLNRSTHDELVYTRLVSGPEGFTPPGLLLGLTYAWYLDNRFAAHIEYKMAILRTEISGLIPEQVKVLERRKAIADFFRMVVFRHNAALYDEDPDDCKPPGASSEGLV